MNKRDKKTTKNIYLCVSIIHSISPVVKFRKEGTKENY